MANYFTGLVLIILGLGCPCWCLPPRLNVTSEFVVDIRQQNFFSIRCEGTEHLFWNWTGDFSMENVNITEEKHHNTDHPFISILTVLDPSIYDTGFFYCYYDGVTNFVTDDDRVASSYAYIFNGSTGLLYSYHQQIMITTADKLKLDCRTTLPNVTVDLSKDGGEVNRTDKRILFDPKLGFTIINLSVHDGGQYTCSTSHSDDEYTALVAISTKENILAKPAINWEVSQHFVVGFGFKINCTVLTNDDIGFEWTVPNPGANYTMMIPETVRRQKSTYRTNTLHLYNATLRDSGIYTCKVSTRFSVKDPNSEDVKITVAENLEPYVNITSVNAIPIQEGGYLKWKVEIKAFPPDPEIIYYDRRGLEVIETERITTEHHISSAESWLKILNITVEDFGNYTVEAILPGTSVRKSHTVLIEVESKPYLSVLGVPSFIEEGNILDAQCKTIGFPIANTTWLFKDCPTGEQDCRNDFAVIPQSEEHAILPPGNVINASLSFDPQESGLLRCEVENEHGQASKNLPVSISDIGGNLVFRHTGNGISTDVIDDSESIDIVMNDKGFELMCGASKFFYKTASITIPKIGLNKTRNETKFSRQDHVFISDVSKGLAGEYLCSAHPYDNTYPKVKKLRINVLDEKRVAFVNANMDPDGNEVVMIENEPMYLNCTVSGTPKPSILWFKDDEPLLPDSPLFDEETVFLNDNLQSIYFKYVFKENVGTYSCQAENRLNTMTGYLTITAPSPGIGTGGKVGLAVALIGIAVLAIIIVYLVKRVKKERKFRKSFRQNELYLFEKGNIGQLNPDCTADEQAELLPYDPIWEVDMNDIKIGKQLGAGAFGRVVKAVVTGLEEDNPTTIVAVKTCKSQSDQSQVRALALELKIMIHLGKHLNIVNLMGANTVHIGKGELWILVEYCRFGNLLSFMHRHRNKFINQIDPMTGKIDFTKIIPDATSPFSPTSHNSGSRGYRTSPITDMDGYLSPTASKFNLSFPPNKRPIDSPPQTPSSVTGSTNDSYGSDGSGRPHVDNPIYTMALQRSVSENPEGESVTKGDLNGSVDVEAGVGKQRLNSIISLEAGRRQRLDSLRRSDSSGKPRLNSSTYSETGSVGYNRENTQITNTDMTTLQSNSSYLSPISPSDSNNLSDVGLDSKGNPFCYDAGIVPAVTAPFTTSDLVCWAWQVAQGMDYLSQRKVLHGDLAARNILLAGDNVIKISDFGLSREMYKKDVYMKKGDDLMPIKWMSIEAIRDRIFSVQSDVWAYGVTLWELFTLGSTPYPGIEVNKDFLKLIEDGHRMDRPKFANKEVYDILLSCWESEPRERPSFATVAERLGILMLPDLKGQYMTMNDPYLRMNEERFRNDTDYLNMLASPNFDNVNKDDEARLHYVNVGEVPDGTRDSNYLDMKAPDSVGYSRVGFNPNAAVMAENSSTPPKSQYLHMGSAQGTPSPMTDVFSPRPNEIPRFTFGTSSSERPQELPELPEEDECASQTQSKDADDLATERSSLINSVSENNSLTESLKSDDPVSSSKDGLQSDSMVDPDIENDSVPYVNLPTHGVDYVNL